MRKFLLVIALIMVIACVACGSMADEQPTTTQIPVVSMKNTETKTVSTVPSCSAFVAREYVVNISLSQTVTDATGKVPSSVNLCFSIFNISHGTTTNAIYIKNGMALLNLPIEVFTPWAGDKYLIGGPPEVAALAVVDENTVIVDGGLDNVYQANEVIDMVDWSSVKGGIYKNEVRFESSRMKFVDGQRFWTAYCRGNVYTGRPEQALACGREK